MPRLLRLIIPVVALSFAGALASQPVIADKPAWAGGGNKHGDEGRERKGANSDQSDDRRPSTGNRRGGGGQDEARRPESSRTNVSVRPVFEDRHRTIVREYYVTEYRAGHCPPGLAKKNNGCMPPGQAKKWQVGHPLPRDVVFYDLPPALVVQFGVPPPGHRYVRVAADILLIAVGTGLVIDAIADLGRL
jgi:Ni/Co efflux regulator RcnB